jgi:hypothetical protein
MASNKTASAMSAQESDWRAEDDMRTLVRAEEIKRDPKRLAAAKKKAKDALAQMQSVANVK